MTGSTEVRSSLGCGICLRFLLGFLVVAPAAWASDGQVSVLINRFMYAVEVLVAIAARCQYHSGCERHRVHVATCGRWADAEVANTDRRDFFGGVLRNRHRRVITRSISNTPRVRRGD